MEKLFTAVQKDNLHVFRNLNCPLYLVLPFYTHRPLGFTLGFSKSNVHELSFQALFRRIFSLVLNKLKCARTWEGEKVLHQTQIVASVVFILDQGNTLHFKLLKLDFPKFGHYLSYFFVRGE